MKENNIQLPGDTCLIDGATSAPHYIFTLPEDKWKNIIIIDIAQLDTKPGTLAVLDLGDVKEEDRYMDVHGVSVTYPLHDLEDKVNIKLVVCQPECVPLEMEMGLTDVLSDKIPECVDLTMKVLDEMLSK